MTGALERAGLAILGRLDPETAHALALKALRMGLAPLPGPVSSPRLATRLFGRDLPNPVGVAAGFDKQAEALDATLRTGFGFVEVGGVTPRPQTGNPRPRLFRLTEDRAVINRFGFNNGGLAAMQARLRAPRPPGVVGVNLGANKDSADRLDDYVTLVRGLRGLADFLTVNVSSPNTPGLRGLQDRAALDELLAACAEAAEGAALAVKIAPELDETALRDVAETAAARGVSAIIATNTTLARVGLRSVHASEAGGLSGRPLFEKSTRALRLLAGMTELPLIGVGGVDGAEAAYAKIRAGASAVQLYSALVFGGVSLGARIARGLDALLARDGFSCVADAVGADLRGA
ncbi:quinone-dependent dihydroorotate dehydrogenase [Rubrimonas cliftonensis]|uniref:Dihydroorotate dehydrogenase (quinone) n=1 Tax=Rubrimonas cliftonensis TaxID=89524 RepID=A0A1H3VVU8_9RHOB|nr:quinone-dependent dihydroorotate dehydrogenase [Rubrimonas cliftonensis]SDZ78916.1 dihydroorotate oxidase A [Rubrimonas cliftonensis]